MKNWLDRKSVGAKIALTNAIYEEKGDTNFVSILILLGIVIALATVFIGFKTQIVNKVQDIINNFDVNSIGGWLVVKS